MKQSLQAADRHSAMGWRRRSVATLVVLWTAGLAACGGGSGYSSSTITGGTAPTITTQPQNQTVAVGATATFGVMATGTAPLSYQWTENGTAISGATSGTYTTPATVSGDNGATFTVEVSNSAGNQTSNAATLTVTGGAVAPTITTQPLSQTVTVGAMATFSLVATGTAPLSYQWSKNGTVISGATSATYTTPATVSGDSGSSFTVTVSNVAGNQTSNSATLTVTAAPVAPTITTQPLSQTVTLGASATFSVGATGTAPLSYQWSKNGTAISGATNPAYTTPATIAADNGATFTVKVSNSVGSQTSNAATLTVNVPPTITTQPQNQTVALGAMATFSVVANGTTPFSYQWYKNGTAISGAVGPIYTTPATISGDNGATFAVKVSNVAGSQTSNAATLTVNSGSGAATPQVIQHVATVANPAGSGAADGNNYKMYIAPTGAGDTIILTVTGLHGHALTITDSAGDTSPTAICSADSGSGLSLIYAFQPSTGVTWIEAAASTTFAQPFDWQITEFNNIASTASQGSACNAGVASTSGTVTPTSFTPTDNSSTGGNLIYNYTALATGTNGPACNASGYAPASGFTLLSGDVSGWINGPGGWGFPKSAQYEVQTTAAAVTAAVTMAGETCVGGSGDPFNSLTIALQIGTAGITAPTSIHVVKVIQLTTNTQGSPTLPATFVIPTPTVGNLRVFAFEAGATTPGAYSYASSVTSSDSCNYTGVVVGGEQWWYAQGCSPCPTCTATFHTNASGSAFVNTAGQFYDVENASSSSFQSDASGSPSCNGQSSVSGAPSITPANSAGLTIGLLAIGIGPATGLTAPSGAVFSCPTYTNQGDADFMCFGDGHGYYYHSSNSTQNWTWSITPMSSQTCDASAVAFE